MTPAEIAEARQLLRQLSRLLEHFDGIDAAKLIHAIHTLAEHTVTLDQLIAHAHGAPPPPLTSTARALLANTTRETR